MLFFGHVFIQIHFNFLDFFFFFFFELVFYFILFYFILFYFILFYYFITNIKILFIQIYAIKFSLSEDIFSLLTHFFIDEKHTQWNLDTKAKVFHEIISYFMKCFWNCISLDVLKENFHSVSLPLEQAVNVKNLLESKRINIT